VPAGLSAQDFAKQHARTPAAGAAVTFELVVDLSRAALRRRVDRSVLVRLLRCQTNRGGRIQRCSWCDSRVRFDPRPRFPVTKVAPLVACHRGHFKEDRAGGALRPGPAFGFDCRGCRKVL